MAAAQKSGSVLQVWLPHPTDEQLRQHAADERRSLSQTIRLAVEDKLEDFAAAAKADDAPASSSRFGSRSGAGLEED